MRLSRSRFFLVCFIAAALALGTTTDVRGQAPDPLDIASAEIVELGRLSPRRVTGREVAIRIEVAGEPVCSAANASLTYGILVDSDKDSSTGRRNRKNYADLGIDARVLAFCVPGFGFFSPHGPVTVTETADGTFVLEIETIVDLLPAVDFYWLAYAAVAGEFNRAPDGQAHAAWSIFEIASY